MTRAVQRERSESELTALRKHAMELASARRETPTTVHLLAAVAARPGLARELMLERSLDRDNVLKASRSFDEEGHDPIGRALTEAREIAKRARGPVSTDGGRGRGVLSPDSRLELIEPAALHVLVALLANRSSAAHRALALSGVDVTRLRAIALANASGVVPARRPERRPLNALRQREGSVVPLMPTHSARPAPSRKTADKTQTAQPAAELMAEPSPKTAAPRHKVTSPGTTSRRHRRMTDREPAPNAESAEKSREPKRSAHEIVHREQELEQVLDVLAKHRANTPCLVGAAGVGKTSVAHAVGAHLAATGQTMLEVSVADLLSGTGTRGALGERLAALFEQARKDGRTVMFFDDVHELLQSGDEAVLEFKSALSRGDVPVLCATSVEAFRRIVEPDAQLARRLVPVEINEPEESEAFFMVRIATKALSVHHAVSFSDEAIAAAIGWSVRYLPGRALPDKAIAALDLAAARTRRASSERLAELEPSVVAEVIAQWANVPVERLVTNDRERLLALEGELQSRVIGHREVIGRISAQLRKGAAGLRHERPLGSFLLLGPTGVGKTETAKAIAAALFGSSEAMTRIDLSEFAEPHALARLIGAPPGYVGHEAGGQLTEAVRRRPYQVVLLDEVEKAHPEVMLAFLQVLDEGRLTDGRGRRVDFRNVVITMTSNLGSRELASERRGSRVGFARGDEPDPAKLRNIAADAAKRHLPLELYGRIDEVLFFAPLSRAEVSEVAERMVNALVETMRARDIVLEVEGEAIEGILDAGGFDPELGARPLRRTIARLVEAPLADLLLAGALEAGGSALLCMLDGEVTLDVVAGDAE